MKRQIDHLVLCVRDLDAAHAAYGRLGFTLTPPARHPWGTGNSLVQLQGNFLELLALTDLSLIPPPKPGYFSFGAFTESFLKKHEGMAMLVFASQDARRDREEFLSRGLHTYEPFDFEREARLPDGSTATVGFSLAFVTDPRLPEAAFFVCQQRAPQHFWKPEYQRHANVARAVVEVTMLAHDPVGLGDLFSKLVEPDALDAGRGTLNVALTGGRLAILDATRLAQRFPGVRLGDVLRKPHFIGFTVAVADLAAAEEMLARNRVPFARADGRLLIAAADNFGAVLEFVKG